MASENRLPDKSAHERRCPPEPDRAQFSGDELRAFNHMLGRT